jgi:IS5 family transposase
MVPPGTGKHQISLKDLRHIAIQATGLGSSATAARCYRALGFAYQGQAEVLRQHAPKAQDRTNRLWRTKLKVYPDRREQNRIQSKTRSRVEHVFALIKLKFGFVKVRFRGLAKNLNRLQITCALVNLCTARQHLLGSLEQSRA